MNENMEGEYRVLFHIYILQNLNLFKNQWQ